MGRDPGFRAGGRAGFRTRALTSRDFLTGTSFALTAKAGDGRGAGFASLWGRGSIAGLALGHSTGTGGWRRGGNCDESASAC